MPWTLESNIRMQIYCPQIDIFTMKILMIRAEKRGINILLQFQIMIFLYSNIHYRMISVINDAYVSSQGKPYLGCWTYFENCGPVYCFIGPNFFSIHFFKFDCATPLVGSQFPDQGLNLGPSSRTVENPLGRQGTPPAFPCFFGNLTSSFSFCWEWRVKIKIE